MPLYEYECDACGQRFEVIRKFSDAPLEECAQCGKGPVRRLPSSPAIQFKGSGWYITDYAQKGKPEAKKESKDTGTPDGAKADAAKADAASKTDSPASTAAPSAPTSPATRDSA